MNTDTLARYVQRFLLTKANKQTRSWYKRSLRPMLEYFGEDKSLTEIERTDAEAYWIHLNERTDCWTSHPGRPTVRKPLSPTTLANYLRAARTFWSEMTRQHEVEYNPFAHLEAPKDNRPPQMKAISAEDLKTLWKEARNTSARDFALVTVLATTGIRAGELASMTTDQLDLAKGETWVKGKRGWRKVFLGKVCIEALQTYVDDRPDEPTNALWVSAHQGALTTDGIRQLIDRLAESAGVRGRHNLHSFRHRLAQAWLDNGINAELLSQALGHANVKVTLHIYGNQDDKRVRNTAAQAEMFPFTDRQLTAHPSFGD
ncbi:MAG: tyrosine-type recombinase/integrase [Caldilineaceae bacterium]|nr:tyrosine-type recombinase/integrase [Caldilineaceae bacterium]